jgi:hypothetical protein
MQDTPLSPPLTLAKNFQHKCLQSHLPTSPPTSQKSYPKFRNSRTTFEIFRSDQLNINILRHVYCILQDGCIYTMTGGAKADEYCFISGSVESVCSASTRPQISQQEIPLALDPSTFIVIHFGRDVSEIPLTLDYAIINVEHGHSSSL